jgi:class 3 adenylate cyclase
VNNGCRRGARLAAMSDRGDERVGDDDRQRVIDLLRIHTGAGRLTLDEFSDRAGEVFAAKTRRDLDAVLADLPPGVSPPPAGFPGPVPGAAPGPAGGPRPRARRTFGAIMSGSRARGRWLAPRRIRAFAFWGGVTIDLREAQIESPVIDITAWAIMGGVDIKVPKGIPVEMRGLVVMGGAHDSTRQGDLVPGAPLVRVHARGMWGGVHLHTARDREARRQAAEARERERAERRAARDEERADRHGARYGHHQPPPLPVRPPIPDIPIPGLPGTSLHDLIPPMPGRPAPEPARVPNAAAPAPPAPTPAPAAPAPPAAEPAAAAQPSANGARPPSGTLTMMVTDIDGSTRLAETLGDRRWMEVLNAHNALVREQVANHDGTEVKAQGDGFLVVFASARRAILAAVDIQRALAGFRAEHPEAPVTVRIGLHTGEIVDVDGDVFGQNVVVAVRIADQASPGEIMVSGLTRDLTLAGGDLAFDAGQEVELKGLSQPWRVHRVSWAPTPA